MIMYVVIVVCIGVIIFALTRRKKMKNIKEIKPDENKTEFIVKVSTEEKGYAVKDGVKSEVTIKHMPQGLQVFDEKGNCVLDVTDRLCRVLGVVDASADSGTITVPDIGRNKLFVVPLAKDNDIKLLRPVKITINSNKIEWKYMYAGDTGFLTKKGRLLYGTY